MAMHQRKMGRKSIRHAAPNSDQHKEDVSKAKQLANARRAIIVSRPAEEATPLTKEPCLSGHGAGWQYVAKGGKLSPVSQEIFVAHHDDIRRSRAKYVTERYDKKLEKNRTTTRNLVRESPLSQFGVTLSPPHGAVLKRLERILSSDSEKNRASDFTFGMLDRIGKVIVPEYERITRRIVTGLGIHLDTKAPHFHLQNTRISEDLKLTGDKGQGTSGSLFILYRELQLGIIDSKSERAKDFFGKMEHFEKQRGSIPADIQLCNFVDQAFERILFEMFPGEESDIKQILIEEKEHYRQMRIQQDADALTKREKELLADLTAVRQEQMLSKNKGPSPTLTPPVMTPPSLPRM
jgi:hypothetical protein